MNEPWFLSGKASEVYPEAIDFLMQYGQESRPRGTSTYELCHGTFHITNPEEAILFSYGRPINIAFAIAEILWILQGRRDVRTLDYFNSNIHQFSDDGSVFNAAYGYRMRHAFNGVDQLLDVISKLEKDQDSRQAVITYTYPQNDNHLKNTKDRPCNITSQFLIRDGAVHLIQNMRSNDAIWGTPYNWIQWSHVLRFVAAALELPVGTMTFNVASFHIYEQHFEEAKKIQKFDPWSWNFINRLTKKFDPPTNYEYRTLQGIIGDTDGLNDNALETFGKIQSPIWRDYFEVLIAYRMFKFGHDAEALDYASTYVPWPLNILLLKNFYQWRWRKNSTFHVLAETIKNRFDSVPSDWFEN